MCVMILPVCKTLTTRSVARSVLPTEIDVVVNGWLGRNPDVRVVSVSTSVTCDSVTSSFYGLISILYYPVENLDCADDI